MKPRGFLLLASACSVLAGGAWAYTSYKNNLNNVGGARDNVELWYQLGGVVPYIALATWIAMTCLVFVKAPPVTRVFYGFYVLFAGAGSAVLISAYLARNMISPV